jgi:ABC-type nitrate/sulfonate/bicarbonate transport system permease component
MNWNRMGWVWRWVVLIAGIGGWQLWASQAQSSFFPPPSAIVARMYHVWFSGPAAHVFLTSDATGNILPSLLRVLASLAIATAIGVPLGIVLGRSPVITDYLNPLLQFARVYRLVQARHPDGDRHDRVRHDLADSAEHDRRGRLGGPRATGDRTRL